MGLRKTNLFSIDAVCWFSSNHLTILLGNVKTIKDNKFTIQYSPSNNIRSYRSWPKLGSSMLNMEIIVPIIPSEVIKYNLNACSKIKLLRTYFNDFCREI